jgi:hypothetical protein
MIAMTFTIELDIGLSYFLRSALDASALLDVVHGSSG